MAGEVASINDLLHPEGEARQISQLYRKWQIQKQSKEEEWKELRNYIFATDTTTTSNNASNWKNRTTIPKLTQIRDNLHAHYVDSMFPNDNWLEWFGETENDVAKEKADTIKAYMKNKTQQGGFSDTISDLLYDYIDTGNVFGQVIWVKDAILDEETGEEIVNYIGPKLVRVSPYDIVFNPAASNFESSPKIVRTLKNIGELRKELRTRPDLRYDEEVLNKAMERRNNALSSFSIEEINKAEGYQFDGFGSLSEYLQSGLIEILEFKGDLYDQDKDELKENVIITVIDRQWTLRSIENPSWLGRDDMVHVGWRERPDNLWAMGPLDNLVGLQYRLDHLENLKADAFDLSVFPMVALKGAVEPFSWQPKGIVHLPEDGDIQMLNLNPQALATNNEIGGLMGTMEELAGSPKNALGIRTAGEKTAFEVEKLDNAAQRIFLNKTNKFEKRFLEKALNKMLETAKRNLDSADLIRVMDDDIGVVEFIEIEKSDITAKGKIMPMGSRHFAARSQLIQNVMGIFNGPIAQVIAPHVSSIALAKMLEEAMGLEKFQLISPNVAIQEEKETAAAAQQAQGDLETEQAVPVEEELLG
tara:strand:- start:1075 stop:2838 length:1764 start_codon:yes stop_codon:yes gene_type:complete